MNYLNCTFEINPLWTIVLNSSKNRVPGHLERISNLLFFSVVTSVDPRTTCTDVKSDRDRPQSPICRLYGTTKPLNASFIHLLNVPFADLSPIALH